jgi:hypothetical protein
LRLAPDAADSVPPVCLADDRDYRERMTRLSARHAHAIIDSV